MVINPNNAVTYIEGRVLSYVNTYTLAGTSYSSLTQYNDISAFHATTSDYSNTGGT